MSMNEAVVEAPALDVYGEGGVSAFRQLGAIEKFRNLRHLTASVAHARVLDIGAGEGAVLRHIEKEGYATEMHALDVSPAAISSILHQRIPGVTSARTFDGYQLPYENDAFDVAILSHVIEHVEDPRRLLKEAARVGRRVFVEVPCELRIGITADYREDGVGHINHYTPRSIRYLVQSCGLVVDDQLVRPASLADHRQGARAKGAVKYFVKAAALRALPSLAPHVFCYHSALLCRRVDSR